MNINKRFHCLLLAVVMMIYAAVPVGAAASGTDAPVRRTARLRRKMILT